jgi:hypothetical protein
MRADWIVIAAATISFGQGATKKGTAASPKLDTWQKEVKECAERSEAVMAKWPQVRWHAHYSPKFNRCFIQETFLGSASVDLTFERCV